MNNLPNPDTKFRISLTVAEMQTLLQLSTEHGDAIDMLPINQKLQKAIAKASLGIITPAYVGSTKVPGLATMARITKEATDSKGAALLAQLRAGESLTDEETYEALNYLIETRKEAPQSPEEIAALDTYMHIKVMKSIGA